MITENNLPQKENKPQSQVMIMEIKKADGIKYFIFKELPRYFLAR